MEKQKVIEKATKCLDAVRMGHGNYRPFGYVEFADKIYEEWEDFYATVVMMAEKTMNKWIPCSEKLPEKKQTVIVSVNDGRAEYTEVDEWTGTGFWAYGHCATAWMPLPEPYKEGEE